MHKLFGRKLRQLREAKGLGIKALAPELGIDYTHLSNLELGYKKPSAELIRRIAEYFKYSEEELKLLAGYIPEDISEILAQNPVKAPEYLRKKFKEKGK